MRTKARMRVRAWKKRTMTTCMGMDMKTSTHPLIPTLKKTPALRSDRVDTSYVVSSTFTICYLYLAFGKLEKKHDGAHLTEKSAGILGRRLSKRQQEKAPEERPAHVGDDDVEHHKTSTGEGTSAPAPEDSRVKEEV